MFQRDYILRMIEMMGDLMRRVKELMDELAQMRLLDGASRKRCGLPLSALETLSAESLTELLSPTPRLFASELLYLRAMGLPAPWEEGRMLRLKSLRLLLTLEEEGPLCELRAPRVQALKLELADLLLPEDLMDCAAFLRQGGAYADMEDALFEAAERCSPQERAACVRKGVCMLREAARAPAQDLAFGRTSAHELRLSARELEERWAAPPVSQQDRGEDTR
ncbi:MAG TPA: hypothetical protein IAC11_00580 [Candidatus Limiplasma pullicola]|nr:hypothetical protein [Candidatus Limiplasma pullicola]